MIILLIAFYCPLKLCYIYDQIDIAFRNNCYIKTYPHLGALNAIIA